MSNLTLLKEKTRQHVYPNGDKAWFGLYQCACGEVKEVLMRAVNSGNTKSCGCRKYQRAIAPNTKHGGRYTQAYKSWAGLKYRCGNPNSKDYENYGGRGITYDPRWERFEAFFEDMGSPPSNAHSIERLDVNNNYCKQNCVWADAKVQARNRTTNVHITYQGQTKILIEWAEVLKLNYKTLEARLYKYNWPVEKAFTAPVRRKQYANI